MPSEKATPHSHAKLFLDIPQGGNYGWGVCGRNLTKELLKTLNVELANPDQREEYLKLPGPFLQATKGVGLRPWSNARGRRNYLYSFFEYELDEDSHEISKQFDLVLAGSNWCVERLTEKGSHNVGLVLQGIDPELFYPILDSEQTEKESFVIFSGGKFEFRKGQDLVLQAFSILQEKYSDICLLNCWGNIWPDTMKSMLTSQHIWYEHRPGPWREFMSCIYKLNGIDERRVTTLSLVPHRQMRSLFAQSDLGVFPNRCEGGSNLLLMEYMACGKPAIVSYTSGHKDIARETNSILLRNMADISFIDPHSKRQASWQECSVEELVSAIEYAYHNREKTSLLGKTAANDMKALTWEASVNQLLSQISL